MMLLRSGKPETKHGRMKEMVVSYDGIRHTPLSDLHQPLAYKRIIVMAVIDLCGGYERFQAMLSGKAATQKLCLYMAQRFNLKKPGQLIRDKQVGKHCTAADMVKVMVSLAKEKSKKKVSFCCCCCTLL